MEKGKFKAELTSQNNLPEEEKQVTDCLLYEKWRDDGKSDHKKRDIQKKIKKQNARKK